MTTNVNYLIDTIMKAKLEVIDKASAWKIIYKLIDNEDIKYDKDISKRTGYPVYINITDDGMTSVCDLGNRLEVNFRDGKSKNIWIKEV